MNERIRELAIQCYETGPIGKDGWPEYSKFNEEKFAELIVRECADIAADQSAIRPEYRIRKHFGVEVTELDEPETPFWRPVMTNTVADLRSVVNNAMNRGEHNIAIALIELIKKNS